MFGEKVVKHCPNCKKDVSEIFTVMYRVDGKDYITSFTCPTCEEDLAREDRAVIVKARDAGKPVAVMMC